MKVAASKILSQGRILEKSYNLYGMSSHAKKHLQYSVKTYNRLERARAFSLALSNCTESDSRAVQAGKVHYKGILRLLASWKAWNGYDEEGRALTYEQRKKERERAGKVAMREFEGIVDENGMSWIPDTKGSLNTVEKIWAGFRSVENGDKGKLKDTHIKKERVRQKEFVR